MPLHRLLFPFTGKVHDQIEPYTPVGLREREIVFPMWGGCKSAVQSESGDSVYVSKARGKNRDPLGCVSDSTT